MTTARQRGCWKQHGSLLRRLWSGTWLSQERLTRRNGGQQTTVEGSMALGRAQSAGTRQPRCLDPYDRRPRVGSSRSLTHCPVTDARWREPLRPAAAPPPQSAAKARRDEPPARVPLTRPRELAPIASCAVPRDRSGRFFGSELGADRGAWPKTRTIHEHAVSAKRKAAAFVPDIHRRRRPTASGCAVRQRPSASHTLLHSAPRSRQFRPDPAVT